METAIIANYTLPAVCHVVCTLLAAGISGINVTNSAAAVNQSIGQHQPATFPDGYVAHPDVGFAYKVYDKVVTWTEARSRCVQEAAQLALIDTANKLGYVQNQKKSRDYAHVGIIRMYDDKMWVAASTGLPLSSLPWRSGEPSYEWDCVRMNFSSNGLENYMCSDPLNYVCELPIREKNAVAVN